jgi:plastocyanin
VTCRLIVLLVIPAVSFAATVTGKVTLEGPAARQKDNSGVVVWFEPVAGKPDFKQAGAPLMLHKNKTFLPHILPIVVGTKVAFPNKDPFFHNAFSNYDGQIFDIGLHAPGTTREFTFTRPGVVRVFCNIHPNMSAVILVLNTPYFAVSDAAGNLNLAVLPPGEYHQQVFHERVARDALKACERMVTVGDEPVILPPITLTPAGHLETHKNKLGKDYPAVIKDQYPGKAP